MTEIAVSSAVPDIPLTVTGNKQLNLSELRGRKLVIFFYPKANTPGCTQESQDFRDAYAALQAKGAEVLGVSRDSLKAQENFKAKHALPFDLVTDTDERLCQLFGVIKEKNMYGRKVMGIERSTFLLDDDGVLRREWRGVKVKGHADEVLAAAEAL
jgi:peroxiredoxin Q/BCP